MDILIDPTLGPGEFSPHYDEVMHYAKRQFAVEQAVGATAKLHAIRKDREIDKRRSTLSSSASPTQKLQAIREISEVEKLQVTVEYPEPPGDTRTIRDLEMELHCTNEEIRMLQDPKYLQHCIDLGDFQADLIKDCTEQQKARMLAAAVGHRRQLRKELEGEIS